MPSGKTHEKINYTFLYLVAIAGFECLIYLFLGKQFAIWFLLFVAGYLFGTYYLSPDLDTVSKPYLRWKWIRFIWKPYRKFFHHRSFWTHGVVVGDIVRVAYMGVILYALSTIVSLYLYNLRLSEWNGVLEMYIRKYENEGISVFAGICLASFMHVISDLIVSKFKKMKKKKRVKKGS